MSKIKSSPVLNMTEGRPMSLLLRFAVPLFIGNLLQQLYNLADTAIAGHLLGDTALAQIGATSTLCTLITNFAFGMNNGLALSVSRNFGAGDEKRMKSSVAWMVTLSLAVALLMMSGFLLLETPLLRAMQVPSSVFDGAVQYLTVILAAIPFTMCYNLESGLLQSVGNSITPLCFLLFSSVLNVVLDLLFMGPFGMGIRGAAIATAASQAISAVLGLAYIILRYPILRFSGRDFRVRPRYVLDMLWTGFSMGLMSALYNIGSVLLQSSINALGNVYIAAQVASRRIAELFYIPGVALGTGVATFASQNYGAGKRSRILSGIKNAILLYLLWWLLALAFVFTLAPAAVRFVTGTSEAEIVSSSVLYLRISIPMIPPMAVLTVVRNALQGMRHSVAPLISSSLELIGKALFAAFLVPVYGYFAVCVCEPIIWVICFVFIVAAAFCFRKDFRNSSLPQSIR